MPANIVVHGGALFPQGDGSLFWSTDTVWMASPEHSEVRPICPQVVHAPLGAAFLGDDGSPKGAPVVEIVDGGAEGMFGPRLIRFSNGACRAESWSGPEPNRPLTRAGRDWVFVDQIDAGPRSGVPTIRVSLLRADGHSVKRTTMELNASWSDSIAVVLSGTASEIVATSRFFPFPWTATGGAGGRVVSGRVPGGNELFYAYGTWMGTGVFELDSGFVQILADLGSDRRHLLIYDSLGAFKRRRVIDVPFGILDTVPDRQELLALRRTDRVEIVTYRWSWKSTGPQVDHKVRRKP
ncbi:hypothetical protein [Candidatus Palauibacter sp.]|uniref:hypothetical protein n=1 Tax=Candidatus Palauibacter sp. TaxID=3101350 RepID=UPI003B025EA1